MKLKEIRKGKRFTQDEVAQAAGVNRCTYANIEAGRRIPSVALAKRIASVLGIKWTIFFEEDESDDAE